MISKKHKEDIDFCKKLLHFHSHNGVAMQPKECIKMYINVIKDRLGGIEKGNYEITPLGFDNLDMDWIKKDFSYLIKLLECVNELDEG